MNGGLGNDTYVVNSTPADKVVEGADAGIDLVKSSVTFTLAANVEALTTASSNINATGNALNNILTGNGGANVLTGNDGADALFGMGGNDSLNGGNGNDGLVGRPRQRYADGRCGQRLLRIRQHAG